MSKGIVVLLPVKETRSDVQVLVHPQYNSRKQLTHYKVAFGELVGRFQIIDIAQMVGLNYFGQKLSHRALRYLGSNKHDHLFVTDHYVNGALGQWVSVDRLRQSNFERRLRPLLSMVGIK